MAGERQGPFDRILKRSGDDGEPQQGPDRAIIYIGGIIIGLAVLLLVLVLPPISILSGDGGGSEIPAQPGEADTYTSTVRGDMPDPPEGLTAASAMFDLAAPADQQGASGITVPLKETETDARALGMYTFINDGWNRLSDVVLVSGGAAARGEVEALPGNVAVLKRVSSTFQIAGLLPAGTQLDEAAGGVLTTLHPLVYLPTADGSIIGEPPASAPASFNIVPGVVAPSPEIVDELLRSSDLRVQHAARIAETVAAGNYAGINLDYRAINPTLKEQYTEFVQVLADALHEDSRTLTLTLPLPVDDGGQLDEGAYDWAALGAAVDTIEIAGELDQELYFQRTEAGLDYITERVDAEKLLITISSLSVERGSEGYRGMPFSEAMALASVVGVLTEGAIAPGATVNVIARNLAQSEGASGLHWDGVSRTVAFSYPGPGGERTVWIANRFSSAYRLELAQRYGLAGVVISDVSTGTGATDVLVPVRQFADTGSYDLAMPNGELFTPTWTASAGALSGTSGDAVTWTAQAEPGLAEITLIVSDGVVRVGQRVALDVIAAE